MPVVRATVAALFVSDLHWSLEPPVARCVEEDWLAVQASYMKQLRDLQVKHKAPIFVAGDLFDKWNSSVYLVNHVLLWLKDMEVYAIPGNHDTPNHNYRELPRSAYWTLVEARAVKHLSPGGTHSVGNVTVSPFASGIPITPCNRGNGLCVEVALIHDLVWTKDTGYEGAPEGKRLGAWVKKLRGYDVAVFGDNHKGFVFRPMGGSDQPVVLNCGTFMRRHSDEKDRRPSVGLLSSGGEISRHHLDVGGDKFLDPGGVVAKLEKHLEVDLSGFAQQLIELHAEKRDLATFVLRWLEKTPVPAGVETIILRALGVHRHADGR